MNRDEDSRWDEAEWEVNRPRSLEEELADDAYTSFLFATVLGWRCDECEHWMLDPDQREITTEEIGNLPGCKECGSKWKHFGAPVPCCSTCGSSRLKYFEW